MLIFLALNERFRSEKETGKVSNLIVILNLTTTNHKVEKGVKPCSHLILSMFLKNIPNYQNFMKKSYKNNTKSEFEYFVTFAFRIVHILCRYSYI